MAKKIKLEAGNVFRVKLLNGLYVFGHIVFFVSRKNQKKYQELNPESYLRGFFSNCLLVNIYSQISEKDILENDEIFFKGVFLSSTDLSTMGEETVTVVDNIPVEVREVEFPETVEDDSRNLFIQKGELTLKLGNIRESVKEKLRAFPCSFKSIISIADGVLFFQGRNSEMQISYYDGWNHSPSDLKYNPELRNKIYAMLKEDPNQSYYNMALKHGFDLARFY
jgi:hypothetical protein